MLKRLIFLFVIFLMLVQMCSAEQKSVAYILEDNSQVSSNVLNVFASLGLNYDIIRDSQIPSTDFSQYSFLLVTENVDNLNKIPFNQMHSIFFDQKVAEKVWTGSSAAYTTNSKTVKIMDIYHEIFTGISIPSDYEIDLYSTTRETHFLKIRPGYVSNLAGRSSTFKPVLAVSLRNINDKAIKEVFFGVPESIYWTNDAKLVFKNSLTWVLKGVDKDNDGWLFEDDCNDNDPSVYPGAVEIPYDGVDQDCDGLDLTDVDNDGYDSVEVGGLDCDDNDPEINPSNPSPFLNCINDPPIVQEIELLTFSEIDLVTITVDAEDPEGDDLLYYINDWTRFSQHGNVFTWQTNYEDAGFYNFIVQVSDGEYISQIQVSVIITEKNQPPQQNAQLTSLEWDEDTNITLNLNDYFYDPEGEDLFFEISDTSSDAEITVFENGNGIFEFVPSENFFGSDWIIFEISDGLDSISSGEVTLIVNPVNDLPTFEGIIPDFTLNEDVALENVLDLNDYFYDVDSELEFISPMTINIDVEIENGIVSFYPAKDFYGVEEIYFSARDSSQGVPIVSNPVMITVLEQGEPPVFNELNCETEIQEDVSYSCSLSAYDLEDNELEFSVSSSENLICEISGDSLSYVSEQDYNGVGSCVLKVSNIHGSDFKTLEVNILEVNDAPRVISFFPESSSATIIEGESQLFSLDAIDVEGSDIDIRWFLNGQFEFSEIGGSSEFFFFEPPGSYDLRALISDSLLTTVKSWNVVVGQFSDFTCSEVGGIVCSTKETCSDAVFGVKDSDACCLNECIPLFEDADSCSVSNEGIKIEIDEPGVNDEIELGETLRVGLDIENNLDREQDFEVEIHLYDLDRDVSVEYVGGDIKLDTGKSRVLRLDLEIPEDIDLENDYVLYVKVADDECNQAYQEIKLKRLDDKIVISDLEIPKRAVCGETIKARVLAENLGTNEQNIIISIKNKNLGISESSEELVLEEYGEDDSLSENFLIKIPFDADAGTYQVESSVSYNSQRESLSKELIVDCKRGILQESDINASLVDEEIMLGVFEESQGDNKFVFLLMLIANLILILFLPIFYFFVVRG